jgi:hypothetical protein
MCILHKITFLFCTTCTNLIFHLVTLHKNQIFYFVFLYNLTNKQIAQNEAVAVVQFAQK